MTGTMLSKNQVKIRRRVYRTTPHHSHGKYLSRRLRRERRVGQEDS